MVIALISILILIGVLACVVFYLIEMFEEHERVLREYMIATNQLAKACDRENDFLRTVIIPNLNLLIHKAKIAKNAVELDAALEQIKKVPVNEEVIKHD